MYQSDTEMLFPTRVIPSLKNLRGPAWKSLVEQAAGAVDGKGVAASDCVVALFVVPTARGGCSRA